jgi:hypothetical protein
MSNRARTLATKSVSQIPRWLRPKLNRTSLLELGLAHWQNLDALHRGEGTPEIMWHIGGGLLTWWEAAKALRMHKDDMQEQIRLFDRVLAHWHATGKVAWPCEADYLLARTGAEIMDELAERIDLYTATKVSIWAENRINEIAEQQTTLWEAAHA